MIANFKLIVLGTQKELGAQILVAGRSRSKFGKSDVDFEKSYVDLSHFGLKLQ